MSEDQKTEEKAESPGETARLLATEKPVPSAPEKNTSEYVVTVDNTTGLAVKLEKLDEQSGKRTEFSNEEYALVASYWGVPALSAETGYSAPYATDVASPEAQTDWVEAYYRTVADYAKASAPQK